MRFSDVNIMQINTRLTVNNALSFYVLFIISFWLSTLEWESNNVSRIIMKKKKKTEKSITVCQRYCIIQMSH